MMDNEKLAMDDVIKKKQRELKEKSDTMTFTDVLVLPPPGMIMKVEGKCPCASRH